MTRRVVLVIMLAAVWWATACQPQQTTTSSSGVVRASQWPTPIDQLTPGGLTPGCVTPRPQSQRTIGAADHKQLDLAYHYTGRHGLTNLEYDHRIPFALCGSNGADNVWPEPADGVKQSTYVHNYKDQLEDTITAKYRAHRLTLAQAQNVFRGDWRHEWCVYVHAAGVECDL